MSFAYDVIADPDAPESMVVSDMRKRLLAHMRRVLNEPVELT